MKIKILLILLLLSMLVSCTMLTFDNGENIDFEKIFGNDTDISYDDDEDKAYDIYGEEIPLLVLDDIPKVDLSKIDEFSGSPYIIINDNEPYFGDECYTKEPFEYYGDLDELGRCTFACANVCFETMPTAQRGSIGQVKPTGWQISKYDFVDGKYLYNRCHLIGYQLTGENANIRNLITGTRYMNVDGMLYFENMVDDYIEENPSNHVLYRVTVIFQGDNLLASGLLMEAKSVEDDGEGICFNVYCYNAQPGVDIDYSNGDNRESENKGINKDDGEELTYILNTNSKKFHYQACSSVSDMSEKNKGEYTGTRNELISMGYSPCGSCKP